jgi:tetratricopeptide (TPR) repeat protein
VLIPVLEIVPNAVDLHEVVAFVYRRYGRFDKALEHLKRAHELDPRSITTGYSLGETHGLLRDFATAEAVLKRLEVFAPTSPRTYQLRAQILLGRDGDARAAARQYLVVIDDLFSFRVNYWQFLIQSQQFEAAMEAVDFGDVAYTDAWSYPVEMTRGLTDFHAGRLDQAEPNLEAALDQIEDRLVAKPAHSGHLNSRCILLGALGRQPEAIEACTTAEAQLVDDAYDRHFLQLSIATGLAMAGATDRALDLIEAGLAAEAGPTVNHYALDPGFKNLHELPRWQELIGSGPKTQ